MLPDDAPGVQRDGNSDHNLGNGDDAERDLSSRDEAVASPPQDAESGKSPKQIEREWEVVRKALEDDRFQLRTAEGIAAETGVSVPRVRKLLKHHPQTVRAAYVLDRERRELYAPKDRRMSGRELWATVRAFITSDI